MSKSSGGGLSLIPSEFNVGVNFGISPTLIAFGFVGLLAIVLVFIVKK